MSIVFDPTTGPDAPPISAEGFLALPDDGVHRELIRGRIREIGMTDRNRVHSRIEASIVYHLVGWLKTQPGPSGQVVCGEAGFRLKGTRDSVVGVDVAIVSRDVIERTGPQEALFDGPPALAVEILSPSDRHERSSRRSRSTSRSGRSSGSSTRISRP